MRIASSPIEIGHKQIVSGITYNGQFPGPLLRFKEGQPAAIEIHNDTDTPEQLHWHGQVVPVDVDGAAEEGTPYILAHGMRRITFTPGPSGFRFYHTHNRAGANLHAGQYSGQVGPVYIEPKRELGDYDREVFLVLKEFEPSFGQGGDMAQHFLPTAKVKELEAAGESSMKESLAKGNATRIRSWLSLLHDQRSHVGTRRTGASGLLGAQLVHKRSQMRLFSTNERTLSYSKYVKRGEYEQGRMNWLPARVAREWPWVPYASRSGVHSPWR